MPKKPTGARGSKQPAPAGGKAAAKPKPKPKAAGAGKAKAAPKAAAKAGAKAPKGGVKPSKAKPAAKMSKNAAKASKKKEKKSKAHAEAMAKKRKIAKRNRNKIAKYVFRWRVPSKKLGKGGVLPKSDGLGRLVRWPKYVKLQRQRKVLLQRLVVPPSLNVFNQGAPKPMAKSLIKFFARAKPETRKQKRDRLRAQAKIEADGKKPVQTKKPVLVKCGFNHVTNLIESGQAKLVLIAHDVDPIELVLWMPTLCVKKNIPFAIIKSKARLGNLVNKKTATCVALCDCPPGRQKEFEQLTEQCRERYNSQFNKMKKTFGSKILGIKTRHRIEKRRRARMEEIKRRKEAQALTGTNAPTKTKST